MTAQPATPAFKEQPLLEVRDFQVELITDAGIIRAVDSVSFSIHRGETVRQIDDGDGHPAPAAGRSGGAFRHRAD
jgi:peptide/nickel transport system ATP-binding protein